MSYYTDLDNDLGADEEAREHMEELEGIKRDKKRQFNSAVEAKVRSELAKYGIDQLLPSLVKKDQSKKENFDKTVSAAAKKKTSKIRGKMVSVKCKCGIEFQARVADRNRGWGKYCSKSCKAKFN